MILKPRKFPRNLRLFEAVVRRLPADHSFRIKAEKRHGQLLSGHFGEVSTEYIFQSPLFEGSSVFHNLRLEYYKDRFLEIDTLLVFPQLIVIFEIKYLAGKSVLFRGNPPQMIRTHMNTEIAEDIYEDPILQAKQQVKNLQHWLQINNLPKIPIEPFAVMSNIKANIIIDSSYKEPHRILRKTMVESTVETFFTEAGFQTGMQPPIRELTSKLLSSHREDRRKAIDRFPVKYTEFLKGVHCPKCFRMPMNRAHGMWHCTFPECSYRCKDALYHTLLDYYLLASDTITNQSLRNFCRIDSPYTAYRQIKNLKLPMKGNRKSSVYCLKALFEPLLGE
ncbi:nuclease-related domain-containing protein [Alteribacter lacisalsi]|uniref:nuclease-related domain-containing protein n=1 Tax=Alteribacter lacisalsi TaxID=2045244 RepID=UPI0013752D81|nr:nuclease-related domain-containing protein [Alteribacter lacisalsi]